MSVSKNWTAQVINGTAGYELIVKGEANAAGFIPSHPELKSKVPQGANPAILLLDLLNASDAEPEDFKVVPYNEKLEKKDQYKNVSILHKGNVEANIDIKVADQ